MSFKVTEGQWPPVGVPGLGRDQLHLLAGCHKKWLNQAPLNLRGLIWLLMMVQSCSSYYSTVQRTTLVAWCSRLLIGPADCIFVTLGPLRCAQPVTQWSGSGGFKLISNCAKLQDVIAQSSVQNRFISVFWKTAPFWKGCHPIETGVNKNMPKWFKILQFLTPCKI